MQVSIHLRFFAKFPVRKFIKNACWGASPNPALRAKLARSCGGARRLVCTPQHLQFCGGPGVCVMPLPRHFLVFFLARYAEQAAYISLYSNGLPHLLLCCPVLRVAGFFLCRKALPFGFELIHFRELRAL